MTELAGNWRHFSARQPKRKRAELVCFYCHSKKIKCDLQSRTSWGCSKCSNCDGQDRDCQIRPSKRGKPPRQRGHSPHQNDIEADATDTASGNDHAELLISGPRDRASQKQSQENEDSIQSSSSFDGFNVRATQTESPAQSGPEHLLLHQSQTTTSPTEGAGRSHDGDLDTGFLQVYEPENRFDAEQQEFVASLDVRQQDSEPWQPELLQSFSETYFEYCYSWCPILDRQTLAGDLERSPMLANALALAAGHIQPPLVRHQEPASCYEKARKMFYEDEEPDAFTALKSIALFYWWAPRPPSTAHRHSSWWWTSVIIRHAQQMNIHREATEGLSRHGLGPSLRRRLWWTVFARERLTSLCQSKPCIIDPEDISIQETQASDFPSDPKSQQKGQIFIHWVRLCGIIGKISKILSRSSSPRLQPFPVALRQELLDWIQTLPLELQLPIRSSSTESFNRDVHQLHLPYLTTIIILHLQRSASDLPQALPPALLAASCITRILRDVLSRGNARFLMPITCWYCGTAFIALLQASRITQIEKEAEEGLEILEQAVAQLQQMWASANVIQQGFERLRKLPRAKVQSTRSRVLSQPTEISLGLGGCNDIVSDLYEDFDWKLLFPFVTRSTSHIAEFLLADTVPGTSGPAFPSPVNIVFQEELFSRYHELLEPFLDYSVDLSTMDFESM